MPIHFFSPLFYPVGRGFGSALTGETHGERTENIIKQDFPHLFVMCPREDVNTGVAKAGEGRGND